MLLHFTPVNRTITDRMDSMIQGTNKNQRYSGLDKPPTRIGKLIRWYMQPYAMADQFEDEAVMNDILVVVGRIEALPTLTWDGPHTLGVFEDSFTQVDYYAHGGGRPNSSFSPREYNFEQKSWAIRHAQEKLRSKHAPTQRR